MDSDCFARNNSIKDSASFAKLTVLLRMVARLRAPCSVPTRLVVKNDLILPMVSFKSTLSFSNWVLYSVKGDPANS